MIIFAVFYIVIFSPTNPLRCGLLYLFLVRVCVKSLAPSQREGRSLEAAPVRVIESELDLTDFRCNQDP